MKCKYFKFYLYLLFINIAFHIYKVKWRTCSARNVICSSKLNFNVKFVK